MSALSDIASGLTAAVGYGTADFVARQASHRIGHVRVLLFLEVFGMILLLPLAIGLESDRWEPSDPWAAAVLLGGINFVASLLLYRSFEYGTLSVVSPLASSYPAVTAVLAFVILAERPGPWTSAGIVTILAAVVLLSRAEAHPRSPRPRDARTGVLSAVGAFAGYGVFFFGLAFVVGPLGPVTSATVVRGVGAAVLGILVLARRFSVGRLPRDLWVSIAVIVVLDEVAFVAFNVGVLLGSVAIVGTLSGLFSAVTVGIAAVMLRERLTRIQYAAIGAIFGGVSMIALG
jgi:drug/metabolite transporter (DMT)-like permease